MYRIVAMYRDKTEVLCKAKDETEAKRLLHEYGLALGCKQRLKIVRYGK